MNSLFYENGTTKCTGSTGHSDPGYPGQIVSKYEYMIKKDSRFLLLSMYRIGVKWHPFTSNKYQDRKSRSRPTDGHYGTWSRIRVQINCRKCIFKNELFKKNIQSNSAWTKGNQYSHKHDDPFAKCRHFTINEYIIIPTDEVEKSQPYMQCRRIMGNYDDEIAKIIYHDVFDHEIPKGIIDLIVSFASGYWLKSVEENFSSESQTEL